MASLSPSYSICPVFQVRRLRPRDREHLASAIHTRVSVPSYAKGAWGQCSSLGPLYAPCTIFCLDFEPKCPKSGQIILFSEIKSQGPRLSIINAFQTPKPNGRAKLAHRLNKSSRPQRTSSPSCSVLRPSDAALEGGQG